LNTWLAPFTIKLKPNSNCDVMLGAVVWAHTFLELFRMICTYSFSHFLPHYYVLSS